MVGVQAHKSFQGHTIFPSSFYSTRTTQHPSFLHTSYLDISILNSQKQNQGNASKYYLARSVAGAEQLSVKPSCAMLSPSPRPSPSQVPSSTRYLAAVAAPAPR